MADAIILEFDGVGRDGYEAVNELLGLDAASGAGDWPDGMMSHTAGAKPGGWVVFEVWESKDAQAQFMGGRLGSALHEAGLPAPTRVEWLDLAAHHNPAG
jgi:hypothetical protein